MNFQMVGQPSERPFNREINNLVLYVNSQKNNGRPTPFSKNLNFNYPFVVEVNYLIFEIEQIIIFV